MTDFSFSVQVAICLLAVFGHMALWLGLFDRLHAIAFSLWLREVLEKLLLGVLLAGLGLAVAAVAYQPDFFLRPIGSVTSHPAAAVYFWLCCGIAVLTFLCWLGRKFRRRSPELVSNHSAVIHLDRHFEHPIATTFTARLLTGIPGNQVRQLEISEKTLRLPRLPEALDSLTIAHLSDLHFTGEFSRELFEFVVERTNAMDADLIAITGDIIDRPHCLPWIDQVLGRLESRLGTYCILGNHELRMPDKQTIVEAIQSAGMVYLGGRWTTVTHRNKRILLAGNELPWWKPLPTVPDRSDDSEVRILLAHTPDQIAWARKHDFDLMMAGHTHGGQIRLPVIGPLVAQSLYGVRFASGVFSLPPTVLHVSRGVSGCQPLRFNCRTELVKLVLRSQAAMTD